MFFWFFFFNPNSGSNGTDRSAPTSREMKLWGGLGLTFFAVLFLTFLFLFISLFIPKTGSFDEFFPAGEIDCYLSGVSEEHGYEVILITKEDPKIFTTPVTYNRYREMDYIYTTESDETCYRLKIFHTGADEYFVSTYDDPSTEEAWKDYKSAKQEGIRHKNRFTMLFTSIFVLINAIGTFFCVRFLIRVIRNERIQKKIQASAETSSSEEGSPEIPEEKDLLTEEMSDEAKINSIDPVNNSWHK